MSDGKEQVEYEVLAKSSGHDEEEVLEHFENVKEKYGSYLKEEEHIWWQVCNRLGIECSSPAEREGIRGDAKEISLADLELVGDAINVKFDGYVYNVTEFEADEERDMPPKTRIGVVDRTGRFNLQAKDPTMRAKLQAMEVQPGDLLRVDGAFAFSWSHGERDGVSVHLTEYTDVEIEKDVDPFEVLPGASDEPLGDWQPCVIRGLCLGGEHVTWKQCNVCNKSRKKDEGCDCQDPDPDDYTERYNTSIKVTDGDGTYGLFLDGHVDLGGHEVTVVGNWNPKRKEVNVLHYWSKGDDAAVPKEDLAFEKAREQITRTLSSFERMPRAVVEKKLSEDLAPDAATRLLGNLIEEGLVQEKEDDLVWVGK